MSSIKRPHSISDDQVRSELHRILASPGFFRAQRMRRFLTFVVEAKLSDGGAAEGLKESVIGHAVFDRETDYDPKSDPVVRVEARRLRTKLEEFYEGNGKGESIRIEMPKGSYVPVWGWQNGSPPTPPAGSGGFAKRRVWWIAAVCALGLLAPLLVWRARTAQRRLPDVRSLAVLPFQNLTGDPSQEYRIAGLTDEITTQLAKIGSLKVISRTSAQQYRTTSKPLPQIARELNVDTVVEGSVSGSPSHFRVTAQLIRAATDSHLWAESYEQKGSDMFALQSEIAARIAQEIGATLIPERNGLNRAPSPEAYDLYLRGRYFWNKRTLEGLEKSIAAFDKVLQRDPDFARAHAALGESYILLGSYGGSDPADALLKAQSAAESALHLDPNLPEAHTVMAAVKVERDRDWEGAAREYQEALRLDPNDPTAHHWYSIHLSRLGRHREAEAEIRRALELDPLSLIISTDAGEAFYWAHEPDQAMPFLTRALELDPDFGEAHLVLAKVYEQKGEWRKAFEELDKAERSLGKAPNVEAIRAHALALSGNREGALRILQQLKSIAGQRYVSTVDLALIYCGLGECPTAVTLLEDAYHHQGKGIDIIGTEPLFDKCRSNARFQALLRRLKLAGDS